MTEKKAPEMKTVILYSHSPVEGGVLRHIEALAPELTQVGYKVLTALNPAPGVDEFAARLSRSGVRVERVVAGGWREVRLLLAWWRMLRCERPCIVHFHQCALHENSLAILLAVCRRVPTVLTEHMPFGGAPGGQLRRIGKRLLLKLVKAVILLGPSQVASYVRMTGVGMARVRGIPPFSFAVAPVEHAWQGVVGFIGEFSELKGVRKLAAMAPRLVAGGYRIKAFGWGPLADLLKEQADKLGVAVQISSFRGDPRQALEQIDLLLLLSAQEGLPLVILEAISAGIPVLTTRVGVIGDYFSDGEGLLFLDDTDADSVLAKLEWLRRPDERKKIIEKGQTKWKMSLLPGNITWKLVDLYRQVGRL